MLPINIVLYANISEQSCSKLCKNAFKSLFIICIWKFKKHKWLLIGHYNIFDYTTKVSSIFQIVKKIAYLRKGFKMNFNIFLNSSRLSTVVSISWVILRSVIISRHSFDESRVKWVAETSSTCTIKYRVWILCYAHWPRDSSITHVKSFK